MSTATPKSAFWRGLRDGWPFIFAAGPFGLLFGVVATEAGFDLLQVLAMSWLVIAGAAQFAALAQMQEAAPVIMVLAASLAVNLRMAMYSAHLAPHLREAPLWQRALAAYILVDNSYAVGLAEFERAPETPIREKFIYYMACALPVWVVWYALTYVGAVVGQSIPASIPIDFAVPITFLAVVSPMVRTLAHLAAALTSVVLALALLWMPYNSGLMVAGLAAMIVGVRVETWLGLKL